MIRNVLSHEYVSLISSSAKRREGEQDRRNEREIDRRRGTERKILRLLVIQLDKMSMVKKTQNIHLSRKNGRQRQ